MKFILAASLVASAAAFAPSAFKVSSQILSHSPHRYVFDTQTLIVKVSDKNCCLSLHYKGSIHRPECGCTLPRWSRS